MKILCLLDSLGSGGAQRQMVTLAELLHKKGYEVSFLVYYKFDFFKQRLDELGIPIHYILETRPLYRIFKVRKFIRRGQYDAVISFLNTPDFLNNISAIGGANWKVITSERSAKENFFLSKKGKVYNWFRRYSDAIICNSYNAKSMWEKYYPKYKDKLAVIYNPVILPEITSNYVLKENGRLNILIAASYQYLKNPIGLIKALTLMTDEERDRLNINWYGRIEVSKGNSQAYNDAIALIKKHDLEEVISLNEATNDIANKMNQADVVALFSELEGLPNAICEGMLIGKPIIMTEVSDYNELIDDSNGLLCDWDSPESIKKAILKAANWSREELLDKGLASQQKAKHLFAPENVLDKWLKQLE